jgi:hypothetical protein
MDSAKMNADQRMANAECVLMMDGDRISDCGKELRIARIERIARIGLIRSRQPQGRRRDGGATTALDPSHKIRHGSNPGYSPVCPAFPGADFRGMREWSANII